MSHALEWPSLAVQWMPGCQLSSFYVHFSSSGSNKEYVEQKMYLSTHTSEGEQNYIMQVAVQLPLPNSVIDMRKYDNDGNRTLFFSTFTDSQCRIHGDERQGYGDCAYQPRRRDQQVPFVRDRE